MPFKKRKNNIKAKDIIQAEDTQEKNETTASIEQFNSNVDMSFFYTSDKHLNSIDDIEIIQQITAVYPDFVQSNKDTQLKKIFLLVLDNKQLIEDILDQYDLTIFDFFKIVFKHYSSLFNTLFIKKVREKLQHCEYATRIHKA